MAVEIERKFLVVGDAWRNDVSHTQAMAQGYLAGPPQARCSVRVRVAGDAAFLNIKSVADGVARDEYEYEIPVADARRMLGTLAGAPVAKRRHHVRVGAHLFEVDEFEGDNAGLVVAEPGERRRVRHRLNSAPMQVAQQFLAALARDWDGRLDALKDLIDKEP